MSFSEKLRIERRNAGYKQREMAEKLNIKESTYSGYETGRRTPDIGTVEQISKILGVEPNTLLGYPTKADNVVAEYLNLIKLLEVEEIEIIKDFKKRGLSLVDIVEDLKLLAKKYK